jgi:hypothetical protein
LDVTRSFGFYTSRESQIKKQWFFAESFIFFVLKPGLTGLSFKTLNLYEKNERKNIIEKVVVRRISKGDQGFASVIQPLIHHVWTQRNQIIW